MSSPDTAHREDVDQAFEELYRRHRAAVYRNALGKLRDHHDAEDVTQTAFLDAYRAVLRGAEPQLPRAWLLAIAENVRRRRFRTAVRRPREEPLSDAAERVPEDDLLAGELREALAALPRNQRNVFLLREIGGFSYGEIAERLDLSVSAVQMLLFRARRALRAELGEQPLGARAARTLLGPVVQWIASALSRLEGAAGVARSAGAAAAAAAVAGVAVSGGASPPADVAPARAPAAAPREHAPPARAQPPARAARTAPAAPAAAPREEARDESGGAAPADVPLPQPPPDVEETTPVAPPPLLGGSEDVPSLPQPPALEDVPTGDVPSVPLPSPPVELPPVELPSEEPSLPAVEPPADVGNALPELGAP